MIKKCRLWKSKYEESEAEKKLQEVDHTLKMLQKVDPGKGDPPGGVVF